VWVNEADALILPSLAEGRPIAVVEAMAMARAVVASDLPGVRELVVDGVNGLLFPPKDERALAEIIVRLIREPQLARAMGRNAVDRFLNEDLSVVASAAHHRRLYDHVNCGEDLSLGGNTNG